MVSNNELNEIQIKNCTCYYFDDMIKFEDFHFDDILIDERSQENVLVYGISYKSLIGAKHFCTRFNEIDGFLSV